MRNFLATGGTIPIASMPEDADAGEFIKVGALYGVAQAAYASGAAGVLARTGVFLLPKATGTAWAQGDKLFWDVSAKKFTKDGTKLALDAVAFVAALSGDAVGQVLLGGPGGGARFVGGQATTVAASDTIVTGLSQLYGAVATFDDNPVDNPFLVSASIGDQNGAPAAGSFLLKTWQNTSGSDPTPAAASTFGKKVNWIAFGI